MNTLKRLLGIVAVIVLLGTSLSLDGQIRIYRQLPSDNGIGFGLSDKYQVEVKSCNEEFESVYTYGITPNEDQVTKKEHLAMFGFEPEGGPATIKVSLKDGTELTSTNCILMNKTYKGINVSYEEGAMLISVCEPMKQLMVRMPSDKANPLMIHVDPYSDPQISSSANVVTFDGGENGKIHEQTAEYDRYPVPNNVDAIVIEDGALFKGTIHTEKGRTKPLTVQGRGMIICREVSKPSNDVKMQYNQMELNDGDGHKIYGVTLVNGRHFAVRVSDDAHVQNVKFYGYRANNDGIVAGGDSEIENCFFKCNDDHIKLYNDGMEVRNCVFYEQSNGAIFQMAWNNIDPGDDCIIENIAVLEWEANCGDPDLGQGGIARSFINHRESEALGKKCLNVTFKNIYIQPQISRFICLNGLDKSITYSNLTLKDITLEKAPRDYNWIYANKANDNSSSIEIEFDNVRFGDRFIQQNDFKTKGTVNLTFKEDDEKYTGYLNPKESDSCSCNNQTTSTELYDDSACMIYPNPAGQIVHVGLKETTENASFKLYDTLGEIMVSQDIEGNFATINIEGLKGCYLLNVFNGSKRYTRQLLVQ